MRPEELLYREQMLEVERYRREVARLRKQEEMYRYSQAAEHARLYGGPMPYGYPPMNSIRYQSLLPYLPHPPPEVDDSAAIDDNNIEPTESESEIAVVGDEVDLADLYTEPYLYLEPHTRAQCFAPNRFITVVPGEHAPHCIEITEFKLLYWQEQKAMEDFPGPLVKGETPKRDVMNYCKKRAAGLRKEGSRLCFARHALFYKCKGGLEHNKFSPIVRSNYISSQVCVHYQLWDIAMVISTTLSQDLLQDTMQRFSASLHRDDPLRSFHELVSHSAPTCCNHTDNWRQHLAMLLSNQSDQYDPNYNHIMSYANTLASEGQVYAAHFACLLAGSKVTSVNDKTSPLALIGLDHTKDVTGVPYVPIQLTELYEYCRALGGEQCLVPFQGTKFLYARELAKVGHVNRALGYLQQLSKCINTSPTSYRARFIRRVYDESMRMLSITGKWPIIPKWLDALKGNLTERKLEISNRSTAYSSRVATPEIQKLAQYMLHRQNSTKQKEQVSAEEKTSNISADHDNLLASGFTWDGQYYRHDHYQGWVYSEGNWVADPALAQAAQDTTAATTSYHYDGYTNNQTVEVDGGVVTQISGYSQYNGYTESPGGGYTPSSGSHQDVNTQQYQTGYSQETGGYTQPETGGYTQPEAGTGYTTQDGASNYMQPQDAASGYIQPEVSTNYSNPEGGTGYVQPEVSSGYTQPEEASGYQQPDVSQPGYAQPDVTSGYNQPDVTQPSYTQPEMTSSYQQPDVRSGYTQPDVGYTQPDVTPNYTDSTVGGQQQQEEEVTPKTVSSEEQPTTEESGPPPAFTFFDPTKFRYLTQHISISMCYFFLSTTNPSISNTIRFSNGGSSMLPPLLPDMPAPTSPPPQ
eukprot:sb/3461999/